MKNLIVSPVFTAVSFFFLSISNTCAQAPAIEWQKSLGGSGGDYAYCIQTTVDGGYILAGESDSNDGDLSGNHGDKDVWVLKLSSSSAIEWQKLLGGSDYDYAVSIQANADGGSIVVGASFSNDGDVSGNYGNQDYWVLKLSSSGAIEWQKSLGGWDYDAAGSIQATADGGYIVAGASNSDDGDVSINHGNEDCWVVKLSSSGAIEWQKSLGGSGRDYGNSIQTTADGGYIVAGNTSSNDGDVSGNHGLVDYGVLKLSSSGAIEWQKSLGGSSSDYVRSIQATADGGYIAAGASYSNDGDVSGNHGNEDGWVVKLSSSGAIEWQKSLGGSGRDYATSIQPTADGGYIVVGFSESNSYDVSGNHGNADYWVVKLSPSGVIQWQKSLGGSDADYGYSIQTTADGGYIVAGYSGSNDGDVTSNQGGNDGWIVKLAPTTPTNETLTAAPLLTTYPNPTSGRLTIGLADQQMIASYTISNLMGTVLLEHQFGSPVSQIEIDLTGIAKGACLLQVRSGEQVFARKVVVP